MNLTKVTFYFLLILVLKSNFINAQGYWAAKANYIGTYLGLAPPMNFQTFSIANKGYIIPSSAPLSPFMYEYDAVANSWANKANVPQVGDGWRYYGNAFAVGGKGYAGCGTSNTAFTPSASFYEYNPTTNVWTQKTNFAGGARSHVSCAGNSINGFMGMGGSNLSDWYQYTPISNTWLAKASLAAAVGSPTDRLGSFSYNNLIYVMVNKTGGTTELWEYNPALDSWTIRFNLSISSAKFYFVINGKAIMNIGNAAGWSALDLTTFTWQHGIPPSNSYWEGFTIANRAFVLGYNNDFFEYISLDIFPGTVPSIFCGGTQSNLTYTINGTFNVGNIFNVELSDATGSFAAPTIIGSVTSTISGAINYTIPQNTPTGVGYRIRISSTSPILSGFTNSSNITINPNPVKPSICMVTVDSLSNYNEIYWDKTAYTNVDSMIIYREVTSNTYKRIGAVDGNALSMYIDTARSIGPANGNPNIGTYRYKIQIRDTCGNYNEKSLWHNTVFFINSSGTFFWNEYKIEGDPISTNTTNPMTQFDLVRDDFAPTGNYNTVGSVAGTQTTLNDPFYPAFVNTADWRVFAYGLNCNVTQKPSGSSGIQSQVVKSKSNIRHNFITTGVKNPINSALRVLLYPNPTNNTITVELPELKEEVTIEIVNMFGKLVYTSTGKFSKQSIDMSNLCNGVYSFRLFGNESQYTNKVVIQK
jgi:hypothetical protein